MGALLFSPLADPLVDGHVQATSRIQQEYGGLLGPSLSWAGTAVGPAELGAGLNPWNKVKAVRLITIDRKDLFNNWRPTVTFVSLETE